MRLQLDPDGLCGRQDIEFGLQALDLFGSRMVQPDDIGLDVRQRLLAQRDGRAAVAHKVKALTAGLPPVATEPPAAQDAAARDSGHGGDGAASAVEEADEDGDDSEGGSDNDNDDDDDDDDEDEDNDDDDDDDGDDEDNGSGDDNDNDDGDEGGSGGEDIIPPATSAGAECGTSSTNGAAAPDTADNADNDDNRGGDSDNGSDSGSDGNSDSDDSSEWDEDEERRNALDQVFSCCVTRTVLHDSPPWLQLWATPGSVMVVLSGDSAPIYKGEATTQGLLRAAFANTAVAVEPLVELFRRAVLPVAVATRALLVTDGYESPATQLLGEAITDRHRHVLRVVGVAREGTWRVLERGTPPAHPRSWSCYRSSDHVTLPWQPKCRTTSLLSKSCTDHVLVRPAAVSTVLRHARSPRVEALMALDGSRPAAVDPRAPMHGGEPTLLAGLPPAWMSESPTQLEATLASKAAATAASRGPVADAGVGVEAQALVSMVKAASDVVPVTVVVVGGCTRTAFTVSSGSLLLDGVVAAEFHRPWLPLVPGC